MVNLNEDDLFILIVDYGNDLIYVGINYIREFVLMIVYNKLFKLGGSLLIFNIFVDLGSIIFDNFKVKKIEYGYSFLSKLK